MATIADELNAISVEHGYTGAAPKTIAGAIDALADTLAGTDVEGKRTIAGAVKALAPYIGTGGGGGTELGPLVNWPRAFNVVPIVETSIALTEGLVLTSVVIDSSSVLVSCLPNSDGIQEAPKVSSGLTLRTRVYGQSLEGVYVATTIENDMTITAVRESDVVPRDVTTMTVDGFQYVSFTFDMPELGENEYLVFVVPQ